MSVTVTEITLRNRKGLPCGVTIVSPEDADRVLRHKWFLNMGYAFSNLSGAAKGNKKINMGRFIIGCPDDLIADHINHNPLDNRRENLRAVTHTQNLQNKRPFRCKKVLNKYRELITLIRGMEPQTRFIPGKFTRAEVFRIVRWLRERGEINYDVASRRCEGGCKIAAI